MPVVEQLAVDDARAPGRRTERQRDRGRGRAASGSRSASPGRGGRDVRPVPSGRSSARRWPAPATTDRARGGRTADGDVARPDAARRRRRRGRGRHRRGAGRLARRRRAAALATAHSPAGRHGRPRSPDGGEPDAADDPAAPPTAALALVQRTRQVGRGAPASGTGGCGHRRCVPPRHREATDERRAKWLHGFRNMRMVLHMNRRIFSEESKKKLWRPCREARALGL